MLAGPRQARTARLRGSWCWAPTRSPSRHCPVARASFRGTRTSGRILMKRPWVSPSSVPVRESSQVIPYLLGLRLANVHLLADTPDTRNSAPGKVGGEEFRCLVPVAVEPGWRLG